MEFLKTLCTVSALLSLALLFLPEKPRIKRAAETAFSLILLLFLIPKDGSFTLENLLSFEEQADDTDGGVFSALPSQGYTVLFWYDGRLQGLVRHTPIPCDGTEGR